MTEKLSFTQKQIIKALEQIEFGSLELVLPQGSILQFKGSKPGADAHIHLHDVEVMNRALSKGDIAFGEDYVDGRWDSDNLSMLLTFLCQNEHALDHMFDSKGIYKLYFRMRDFFRPNSKIGSRKNIEAHYDVGNDFYSLWLDETMTYSSALFGDNPAKNLADAQRTKYGRILNRLSSEGLGTVLEIGCGWGGFAETAAKNGLRVTGLTVSPSQAEFALQRLRNAGLSHATEIRLQDYRDEKECYDNIVSIEMFEAVGEQYWPTYFETIKARLKENGRAVVQTITIENNQFEGYRTRSDFIRQYIFPGGMLPSHARFTAEARKAGLEVQDSFGFGIDYARTLNEWLIRFDAAKSKIRTMGYPESFVRKWRYYLAACLGGFVSGAAPT